MAGIAEAAVPLRADGLVLELRHRLLGPFTLDVEPGEVVALIGPNGSGKTTFIRLALGIDRSSDGASRIFGRSVDPLHPPVGVAYVPDRAEFWDWVSGVENVRPFTRDGGDAQAALERVGLGAVAERPVRTYSRGMRQRLAIARALAAAPGLLVMDEPTIALDEEGAELLGELVAEFRQAGRSVLVASHDESFVARLGGRIVRFRDGRLAA